MNYHEAIEYLYAHAPMFQKIGEKAYKTGLENTYLLDQKFRSPHRNYKTIHIGGTNGKGSCSHLLASVLQCAGYRVGLYTSPHLKDFRERIRIDGEMISEQRVIDFIEQNRTTIEEISPSFFEITTALAFLYFAEQKVDFAVIEVGLGGTLDCTNIISPEVAIITNISYDHTHILGETLEAIATQKAGIIKPATPVVIGEYQNEAIKTIFERRANELHAPIRFAQNIDIETPACPLQGIYQTKNKHTVAVAVAELQQRGIAIAENDIRNGFAQVLERTHLQGRWQKISENPLVVCDTGHNEGGFRYLAAQLEAQPCATLRIVIGMVGDKDIDAVLRLLPRKAVYYFTKASIPRALNEHDLQQKAQKYGLCGRCFATVNEALACAKSDADTNDFIFVGGSNFVVAEVL